MRTHRIIFYISLAVLLIPNILLCFTEHYTIIESLANLLLPAAAALAVMLIGGKLGRNLLILTPFFILGAFQLVLLYLYGRSIIAVDMFLNLVTTNSSEAGELLGNLLPVLAVVIVVFVPPICAGVWLSIKGAKLSDSFIRRGRRIATMLGAAGLIFTGASFAASRSYSPLRDIYPLNVCYNIYIAVDRTMRMAAYDRTSADYTYDARSTHPADEREVYIFIIGETSRAANWQLFGYPRPTTPLLAARTDIMAARNALSESNTTHKSVPLLLSPLSAEDFGEGIFETKGILTAFKEAGFRTAFISNQRPNHSFIDKFAFEADTTLFIREIAGDNGSDLELLAPLDSLLRQHPTGKLAIVLHTYGSHFNYRDRYTEADRAFRPDTYTKANADSRAALVNAYDNSLRVTDRLIDGCISRLDTIPSLLGGVIYTSDHGEDIYDNGSKRFLHASPLPSYNQVHVPFVAWLTPAYRSAYPTETANLRRNVGHLVSTSRSFTPTALQMAGIETPRTSPRASLMSESYSPLWPPMYLDDHNRARPLSTMLNGGR